MDGLKLARTDAKSQGCAGATNRCESPIPRKKLHYCGSWGTMP